MLSVRKPNLAHRREKVEARKNKVSTSFGNAEFQHFSISATIKQTFSIRKTCSEGNNFLQASKTLSKETLLGFEKKFQRPGKNGPTYL